MGKIWLTFLMTIFLFSCGASFAQEDLVPVFDSLPQVTFYEQEEITLEEILIHKYNIKKTVKVDKYVQEKEKELKPEIKKGRFTLGGGYTKKDDSDIDIGDKILIKPEIDLTDEFSLIMVDKRDLRDKEYSNQEFGFKYKPKWFQGSSFSVLGSDREGRQKVKFNTDFYLW